jgi:hypothetical protein
MACLMPLSAFASVVAGCQQHGLPVHVQAADAQRGGHAADHHAGHTAQAGHGKAGLSDDARSGVDGAIASPVVASSSSVGPCISCIAGCCAMAAPVTDSSVVAPGAAHGPPSVLADPWRVGDRSGVLERPPSILVG